MTDNTQPEAREFTMSQYASKDDMIGAMRKRIAELESELEAVGAGGVQALSAAPAGFVPVAAFDRLHAHAESLAARLLAASPTPPAEQQIKKPNVVLELPDGDDRVARVFFSEMKGDTLHLCIKVTEQAAPKAAPVEPTGKQSLQVQAWVLPNGEGGGQFSWEPQDERFWTKLVPQQETQEPAGEVVTASCDHATVRWLHQTSSVGGGDPRNSRAWPKVSGVSRDEGHSRALLVFFAAEPTDDEVRAVHDTLAAAPTAKAAPQQEAQEPVAWRYNRLGSCVNPWFKEAGREADDLRVGRWDTIAGLYMKPSENHVDWTPLYAAPQQEAPKAAPSVEYATMKAQNDQFEHALAELVDLICPGLDTGNLLVDAKTAGDAALALHTKLAAPQPAPAPLSDDVVKDAARYRWLRATTNYVTSNGERIDVRNMPEKWDAAIDAAIAAQGGK